MSVLLTIFLLFSNSLAGAIAVETKIPPLFHEAVLNYGFHGEGLESGSHIIQTEVAADKHELYVSRSESSKPELVVSNKKIERQLGASTPKQWLAWYFVSSLSGSSMGFTSFSSTFVVPPLPKKASNLAIFNALQASYDPTSYNWILQPVLMTGEWMAGTSKSWGLTSVMCPGSGSCLFTKLVETQPGNTILGTITQLQGN